jgi:NADPH:quinone reductase-like Zn-dependent oxidoreductase
MYFANWFEGPPNFQMGLGLGAGEEDGMLADYVILPEDRLVALPETFDFPQASALPCAALTAWNAVFEGYTPIGPESSMLVLGTGGVSLFAMLFGLAAGARVFATSSQDDKRDRLFRMGARDVVNYRSVQNWGAEIFNRSGGVDKVVDVGGTGTLNQSLAALKPGGEVAIVGFLAGAGEAPNPYFLMGKGRNHPRDRGGQRIHVRRYGALHRSGRLPASDRPCFRLRGGKGCLSASERIGCLRQDRHPARLM